MKKLEIGYTACYIRDYGEKHLVDLPFEAARCWASTVVGTSQAGCWKTFSGVKDPEDWLNKLFVVVGVDYNGWIALYNHDGKFSVREIHY